MRHRTRKLLHGALALLPVALSMPVLAAADDLAAEQHHRWRTARTIQGVAVTGHNDVLGKPFFDWGPPFGIFGFATIGVYNAQGPMPLPLTESTPRSAILATRIDPNLLASTGVSPDEVDPSWLNVPLRQVPVQYSFGKTKPFPGIFEASSSEKGQAAPNNPITVEQWMRANGTARIVCEGDHYAHLKLQVHDLIPNRMYAVWATLGQSRRGDPEVFPSIPVGGTPNIIITDRDGSALYERPMQFCPLRPATTDRPMLVINVQYHSNHQNYGGINGPPIERIPGGYWIGTVIHNHLQFPVNVTPLQ
jgi:hypothetical protein